MRPELDDRLAPTLGQSVSRNQGQFVVARAYERLAAADTRRAEARQGEYRYRDRVPVEHQRWEGDRPERALVRSQPWQASQAMEEARFAAAGSLKMVVPEALEVAVNIKNRKIDAWLQDVEPGSPPRE
jgi:hypothetical protein